jgi:peptide/nickel transport system permease protein
MHVRFLARWPNRLGLLLLSVFVATALAAPLLSPMDPDNPSPFQFVGRTTDLTPHPPDETVRLGTLPGQVDVYHALVWGTRDAMVFGVTVAVGAFLFGVTFGAVAGNVGGAVNSLMMRLADAFLTFPVIASVAFLQQLVAVTIESMGGIFWFNNAYLGRVVFFEFTPPGWASFLMKVDPLMVCLILFLWMPYARLVNASVITLKRAEFIQAARSLGGGTWWVTRRHLIPNVIGPAVVLGARDVGNALVLQATFTFIGLGGNSPWGLLLTKGRDWIIGPGGNLLAAWWVYLPATMAVVLFGVTWNLLGDGLNETLDPRSHLR